MSALTDATADDVLRVRLSEHQIEVRHAAAWSDACATALDPHFTHMNDRTLLWLLIAYDEFFFDSFLIPFFERRGLELAVDAWAPELDIAWYAHCARVADVITIYFDWGRIMRDVARVATFTDPAYPAWDGPRRRQMTSSVYDPSHGGAATSAQLWYPYGVAVDMTLAVYIADTGNQRIRKVAGGIITTFAGTGSQGYSGDGGAATLAELETPTSVAVDSTLAVYVADDGENRIRKVVGGNVTTVAGTGNNGNAGDGGDATSAQLHSPFGVAVDSTLAVYIADTANHRIRILMQSSATATASALRSGTASASLTATASLPSAKPTPSQTPHSTPSSSFTPLPTPSATPSASHSASTSASSSHTPSHSPSSSTTRTPFVTLAACGDLVDEYLVGIAGTSAMHDLGSDPSGALISWQPGCGVSTGGANPKDVFVIDLGAGA